jgi:hypothetical protein
MVVHGGRRLVVGVVLRCVKEVGRKMFVVAKKGRGR